MNSADLATSLSASPFNELMYASMPVFTKTAYSR